MGDACVVQEYGSAEAEGSVRILWVGAAPECAFPAGRYRVDGAENFEGALDAVERAGAAHDPYAACFLPWDHASVAAPDLDDLLRADPDLFLVVETPHAGACPVEFQGWLSPDRCLCLPGPVLPSLRQGLVEHLGARWLAERRGSRHASLLEAEARGSVENGKRSEERLRILYGIIEQLHGSVSVEEALRVTLGEISRFLGATTGSLLLLEGGDRLRVLEAVGPNRERILGLDVPLAKSRIARFALAEKGPILVEDIQDSDRFQETAEVIRFRARSILSIPMFSAGQALGVLNFGGDHKRVAFTEQDRELVVTLGRHVAVALEKARLVDGLSRAAEESIRALAGAIEAKDAYTRGHSDRVTRYSRLVAEALEVKGHDLEVLVRAGILHDVGKIGVPEGVLHKPGKLDAAELQKMQRHPEMGEEIVREILSMNETLPLILYHHERFDGTGYPSGIAGDRIPLGARIMAVADTYDAMTSDRPYRTALSPAVAFEEIARCLGTQFDPEVGRVFLDRAPTWLEAPEPAP